MAVIKALTGQRREESIELYDYRARMYDPLVGSFLSPDTIVPGVDNPLAWNRFAYVENNPIRYTDPTGHCAEFGDDACWSEYERLKHFCPECEVLPHSNTFLADATIEELKAVQILLRDGYIPRMAFEYRNPNQMRPFLIPEKGTVSVELSGSANLPGLEGVADIGWIHFDAHGNFAIGTLSLGGGGTTDVIGFSGGPSITLTNGDDLTVLPGKTAYLGGEIEAGVFNVGANGLALPNDVKGLKTHLAFGPEIPLPVAPASVGGGADHFFDRSLLSSKVTPNGREFGFFVPMSVFFGN